MPATARTKAVATGGEAARPGPARAGAQARAGGAGNQALQAHLRAGAIRARLEIGAANDPVEAEADRLADNVMQGAAPCACGGTCDSCGGGKIRRKADSDGGAAGARADALPKGAGRSLDRATAAFFEPRFGADLSHVRVHDDATAAQSARAMKARAFTIGDDIGFAPGAYDPHTDDGRRLLAHELAHVMQGGTVVRRAGDGDAKTDPAAAKEPSHAGPLKTEHAGDFDPCSVQAGALSNYGLMAELNNTSVYLKARKKGQDAYYDYANLGRRLVEERKRRIAMGHVWLGSDTDAFPATLYQLNLQGDGVFSVSMIGADSVANAPADNAATPLLTPAQFDEFLMRNGIPKVDVEAFYAHAAEAQSDEKLNLVRPPHPDLPAAKDYQNFLGGPGMRPWGNAALPGLQPSGLLASPFDIFSRGAVMGNVYSPKTLASADPNAPAGAEADWRGSLAEYQASYGDYDALLRYRDLNRVKKGFPVFDTIDNRGPGIGDLESVAQASGANLNDLYADKISRMAGTQDKNTFNQMIVDLNAEFGTSLTAADINQRNYLRVPDDHVDLVKALVHKLTMRSSPRILPILDGVLRTQGEAVSGVTYNNWNDVQTARSSGVLTTADYRQLLSQLSPRAQQRIRNLDKTSSALMTMQDIRTGTQKFGPGSFSIIAPPELLDVRRLVADGMPEPEARAQVARASGKNALAFGGGTAAALDLIQYGISGGDPRVGKSLLAAYPAQVLGGAGGGYLQTQWNMRMLDSTLQEAMTGGSVGKLTMKGIGLRLGGGAAIGGPVAALTTWGQMGLQELAGTDSYSGIDYAAKGARALSVGALAAELGPLGFAGYCAVAGTPEAPGVGTAIGFGIGLVGYVAIDLLIGDSIEKEVRDAMGEQGCKH